MNDKRTLGKRRREMGPRAKRLLGSTYDQSVGHGISHVRVIPVSSILIGDSEFVLKALASRNLWRKTVRIYSIGRGREIAAYRALAESGNAIGPVRSLLEHTVYNSKVSLRYGAPGTVAENITHANLVDEMRLVCCCSLGTKGRSLTDAIASREVVLHVHDDSVALIRLDKRTGILAVDNQHLA